MSWSRTKHVSTSTRKRILKRDNHTCQTCGTTEAKLHVDHIDNTRNESYNLDSNLQVLCAACHGIKTRKEALVGCYPSEKHPDYSTRKTTSCTPLPSKK